MAIPLNAALVRLLPAQSEQYRSDTE